MTPLRALGIGVSGWELIAFTTGRIPALTDMLRTRPLLAALVIAWLANHLLQPHLLWHRQEV